NIFYEDGYVKIGDYGLAKIMAASQHSGQTVSVGTVHYMAPEVGSGNYDRTIDIYALGVMLYEMLLGKVPFSGATMGEVLMKHLTAQPNVDELPAPFPNVIRKALAKDPKDRYQTVQEMMSEIFEVADIERSVAAFEPASLSARAAHAAADLNITRSAGGVAVLGTGSSNAGPPPIINPAVTIELHGRLGRFQHRLDRLADRVDRSPLGRKVNRVELPNGKIFAGVIIAGRGKRAETIASTLTIAALTALPIGFISNSHHGLLAAFSAFVMMAAIGAGTVLGTWLSYEKLRVKGEWTPRLIVAALATGWSAMALAPGQFAYDRQPHEWFLAMATIMLLGDWIGRFNDGRRGNVSTGRALKMAIFAFIVASIFDCRVPLMGFSALVASLLVQMIGRAWPAEAAYSAARPDAGQSEPVAVSRGAHEQSPALQQLRATEDSSAAPTGAVMQRVSRGNARGLWWMATIAVFCLTVAIATPQFLAHPDAEERGWLIISVIAGWMTSLFCLSCAIPRYKKGMWRGVFRKAIFFGGLTVGICSGAAIGLFHLHGQDMAFAISLCLLGVLPALLIWLVPTKPWQPAPPLNLTLPFRRTIDIVPREDLKRVLSRQLGLIGYEVDDGNSRDGLWIFERGWPWSHWWNDDVRRWPARMNIAVFDAPGGMQRLSCYFDLVRGHRKVTRKQLAVLQQEFEEFESLLSAHANLVEA
ncbi:MAG TPA: protein kinase, partial [Phycisphaerae bacterium]|nr:protein kinase [Phycisphaerae bacterium]